MFKPYYEALANVQLALKGTTPVPEEKEVEIEILFCDIVKVHREGLRGLNRIEAALDKIEKKEKLKARHDVADVCYWFGFYGEILAQRALLRLVEEKNIALDFKVPELRNELKCLRSRYRYDFNPTY